ncbi:hypothetical protein K0040_12735 [Terrisporobacter petrolearius]|uniref:hypothetical protein n=1 Tax=Terrisporobacter petrolearius TaxID=1460447 RepID=UPI001D16AE1B|nr:hypothetical protein [Terrisporobacter petrolearius]MCC3865139.1 hypothetical protein [Terrisporobacter petrolearius]
MTKLRRFIWIIIIVILLAMTILAFNVSKSFVKDTDINLYIDDKNILFTTVDHQEDITKDFIKNEDISKLEQLEKISPVVVKVKVDSSSPREIYEEATLTKVTVKEVLKGNLDKGSIYVFEPLYILTDPPITINSLDGYNVMDKDLEYILFLRDMRDSNYTEDNTIYMPTTTLLSKYSINDTILKLNSVKLINNEVKYYNVKDLDIISGDSNDIKKYNNMKLSILEKYVNID